MRDMYYGDPTVVNIDALREDANEIADGRRYNREPEDVVIHFHKHGVPCLGKEHEEYPAKKTEQESDNEGK